MSLRCSVGSLGCLVAVALLASAALGQSFPAGSGTFSGKGKLKVPGCDKVSAPSSGSLYTLDANGVFTESDPGSDATIVGSAQPIGSNGRAFAISYAPGALDELVPLIEEVSSLLCQSTFTLDSIQATSTLKLNKRLDRAKLRGRLTYAGNALGVARTGRLKTKERGPWTTAP